MDALDAGQIGARRRPDRFRQDRRRRVRHRGRPAVAGRRAFYTAPIKALSNQKFHDLVARYGAERVGLLTGDNAINGDAPVVVMTTEVLRNMIYGRSQRARRPRPGRARRGALPAGHLPRPGVGGGHHPPPRLRAAGVPVGDGEQRQGAHRVDHDGARPDDGGARGEAAGAPGEPVHGRRQDGRTPPPAADAGHDRPNSVATRLDRGRHAAVAGWARAAQRTCPPQACTRRAASRSSNGSTTRPCCPRSTSSSAATSATKPPGRASPLGCA